MLFKNWLFYVLPECITWMLVRQNKQFEFEDGSMKLEMTFIVAFRHFRPNQTLKKQTNKQKHKKHKGQTN